MLAAAHVYAVDGIADCSPALPPQFTSRAQGSMERLWAAMPERATLVALEPVPAGASAAAGINGSSTGSTGGSGTGSSSGGPDLSSCREVLADSVAVGQLVLVRAGEQLPLDGEVVWGVASVSQAHISGESQPARVAEGAWLPAGALSHDGALVLRVTALAGDSTPARMARMAAQAQVRRGLGLGPETWGCTGTTCRPPESRDS